MFFLDICTMWLNKHYYILLQDYYNYHYKCVHKVGIGVQKRGQGDL